MGPVHLTIPVDVSGQEVSPELLAAPGLRKVVTQPLVTGDPDLIYDAVSLLDTAERPVIVAGSGAYYAGASEVLDELAIALQIPVVTPIWDRGCTDHGALHFMGVVGAVSGEPRLCQTPG
jgi:acetolactate synthase I/II/III large subunit